MSKKVKYNFTIKLNFLDDLPSTLDNVDIYVKWKRGRKLKGNLISFFFFFFFL